MTDAVLEVRGLRVWFPVRKGVFARAVGNVKAVDGVSFALGRGETLGIVGESGSGKTTVARAIVGLQRPTAGDVLAHGRVSMVFQDPLGSLNPRMTLRESVDEVLRANRPNEFSAAGLLSMAGMGADSHDRYPHEISGGQRQRACIARALASSPDILVCDEAVSALDLSVRATVLDLLARLKARFGLSMVFVTHDLGVARHVADRIAVMHGGRIVESGPAAAVLGAPREAYTRSLVAAVPRIATPPLRQDGAKMV